MSVLRRDVVVGGGALVGLAASAGWAFGAIDAKFVTLVDNAVAQALAAHAAPGVQVAIAARGQIAFSRGYGFGDIAAGRAVDPRSVFRIGSLTKQFTAAAAIKLAAMGRLDLNAPVATYLPFMRKLKPFSTLELMHHAAGLHSDESDASLPSDHQGPRTQVQLAEEIAAQQAPFDFEPGTAWLYSNANYIVLGAVIEAVTKTPLARAASDLVFAPLTLTATAFDLASAPAPAQVTGYSRVEGAAAPFAKAAYLEVSEAGGAGAMRSTAEDLCRWHTALFANKLFGREHVALMTAPGKLRDGRVSGANRFSPDDAHYGETQYACGLLVAPPSDAYPSLLHYGAINGFAAVLQTWTDEGVTMAVLCNGDIGPAAPFRAVRQAVTAALLAKAG